MQPPLPRQLQALAQGLLAAVPLCAGPDNAAEQLGQHQAGRRGPWLFRHLLLLTLVQSALPDASDGIPTPASRDVAVVGAQACLPVPRVGRSAEQA